MEHGQKLIGPLAHWLAAGKLEQRIVLPALQALSTDEGSSRSLYVLYQTLASIPDPALQPLTRHVWNALRNQCLELHARVDRGGGPTTDDESALEGLSLRIAPPWRFAIDPNPAVSEAVKVVTELAFLAANAEKAPHLFQTVKDASSQALATAHAALSPLLEVAHVRSKLEAELKPWFPAGFNDQNRAALFPPDPAPDKNEAEILARLRSEFATAGRERQEKILDLLCSWPTPAISEALRQTTTEAWAQDRAVLNLTLRFGRPEQLSWNDWSRWLTDQCRVWDQRLESLDRLIQSQPQALLLVIYSQTKDPDPTVLDAMVKAVASEQPAVEPQTVIGRWIKDTPVSEQRALLNLPEPKPPPLPAFIQTPIAPQEPATSPLVEPAPPPPPPAPPKPSFWEDHLQPLFVENWYIVAGIVMVILGSSLLAYYTWDKHWFIRYTIMPALLAIFTWSLAGVGAWIEKKGAEFKTTAAILRGAAIGLLPINFMAMALLSADEKVPQKGIALLVMAAIYFSLFGWSLRNWCAAVEPRLGNLLGGTLLFLNALVAVGPLARTVGHLEGQRLLVCLGAGFYVGFVASAAVIVRFAKSILTREMAEEKRVPWFLAAALAITYLQVFVWVHSFMRHLPHAHTYSLLVIGVGWLVLFSERRALELRQSPQLHGGESFLGFAFIFLGLLMGFGHPTMRILSFEAAGIVWLYQALPRNHPLHYWISLMLLGLGAAAVGLLKEFPGEWLPAIGLVVAVAYGLGGWFSRKLPTFSQACFGMQVVALVITTLVAPLAQWHYGSEPFGTAGWLVLVAALFAWRSFKDQKMRWLHVTMLVLALALPYAGFMDVTHHSAHHNQMAFGLAVLSFLWLAAIRVTGLSNRCGEAHGLMLQARSTVLCSYGVLALAAMLLRVVLGDTVPAPLWYRDYMDYTGPILITLALIPATYYSRSLLPAMMAVAIIAVLFPELRANLQQSFPWLAWGSGFGSSIFGLLFVWLAFFLRQWWFLRTLPGGDPFGGGQPFPVRRHDHTLFTWPVLAAALFLIIKVDTWNFLRNFLGQGVHLKTASALLIAGIAWTFGAVYFRQRREGVVGVHLGWVSAFGGIYFAYWNWAIEPHWSWPFLTTACLLQVLYWLYRYTLEPRKPWVRALLTEQVRAVLLGGSGALAVVCSFSLIEGYRFEPLQWLYWFIAAQLIWHGLRSRHWIFGAILFFQLWVVLLALTAPGEGALWERLSVPRSFTPTAWFFIGVQIVFLLMEILEGTKAPEAPNSNIQAPQKLQEPGSKWNICKFVWPVLVPAFAIGSALTFLLGLFGLFDGLLLHSLSQPQQILLIVGLLLTARAQVSVLFLLVALLLSYVSIHHASLAALADPEDVVKLLAEPWRLSAMALAIVLVMEGIYFLKGKIPALVTGPFALPFFRARSRGIIFWPAALFALAAALYHTFDSALRQSAVQLWAPYIGAATFALIGWFWVRGAFFGGAGFLLLLGNVHVIRVFAGAFLRAHGLSEIHLVCLGAGLTLLQASALTRTVRNGKAIAAINLASLGLAFLVLGLLSANYFTAPDLAGIKLTRFVVSGVLAWLAGQYFRRAARHPGPGEAAHVEVCEAIYHFGLVMAIWCFALIIPWFRQPMFTLIALGLPVLYFYWRAETGGRRGEAAAQRYRNSSAVLSFVILGLYTFKSIFHMVLFPGTALGTVYYHYNAPVIIVLAVIMLRLHGLGGTMWLAFYGGLALMVGTYFALTALPGLSPFDFPVHSAWTGIVLAHFWILVSYSRSPLRSMVQRLARLDDGLWHSLRHYWGICLLLATQGLTIWGLTDYQADTFVVAPLIAAAASIFIHQGIIRLREMPSTASAFDYGILYLILAALELTLALHMDFLVPSYLAKAQIVWVILALWALTLGCYELFNRAVPNPAAPLRTIKVVALYLGALVFAHILYHRPWSIAGLWAMALAGLFAALTPQKARGPSGDGERFFGALLLWIPTWLMYFSQAPIESRGLDGAVEPWPVLAATAGIFVTGFFARIFPKRLAANYDACPRSRFHLFDSTLVWLKSTGSILNGVTLWITLVAAGIVQVAHYQSALGPREFSLLILLEAALAVSWFYKGKERDSMPAYYLMQVSAVAFFASIRRHLMLTTSFWTYELDVWASLACSVVLAGARQALDVRPRNLRIPLLTTMFTLPVLALVWVVVHGLGINFALLVVGLHSVLFGFLGKGERESPYNIVALSGFVAFIVMTFYSKLHLKAIHAYVIPVCLGILVLQELFRARIKPDARNWIRLISLMAMLGSSGYYALADPRHAITFNLTMIILCLLAMGLGSLMQIRLYLALGFAGLMVDLISIVYKVLVQMERSARMTIIGSFVLVIGAILVFGAIYYKTKKAVVDAWIAKWRDRLKAWE